VHFLTKFFIVVAAVLSVLVSALVISYAVNTDRILANYSALQAVRDAQDAKIGELTTKLSSPVVTDRAALEGANRELAARETEVRDLQTVKAQLENERNRAQAELEGYKLQVREAQATVTTQSDLIKSYTEEVRQLRTSEFASRRAALEMEERMSDLESQREVLEQNYRALQEELSEFRRTTELARSTGGSGVSVANQPYTYSGPTIYGTVDEVTPDPATGGTLVKISVGTNDRVAKNMRFGVVRNGQFVGNLVVISSDLKWSLAMFDSLGTGGRVEAGDKVQSRFQ
jgi:hypothetical protein